MERYLMTVGKRARFIHEYGDSSVIVPTSSIAAVGGTTKYSSEDISYVVFYASRDSGDRFVTDITFDSVSADYFQSISDNTDSEHRGLGVGVKDVSSDNTVTITGVVDTTEDGSGIAYYRIIGEGTPTVVDYEAAGDWASGYTYSHAVLTDDVVIIVTNVRSGSASATNITEDANIDIESGDYFQLFSTQITSDGTFSTTITRGGTQQYVLQIIILRKS